MNPFEETLPGTRPSARPIQRWLRRRVLDQLETLPAGSIEVYERGRPIALGAGSSSPRPPLRIDVLDLDFYRRVAFGGSVGAGEAYMLGQWRTNDLTRLVQLLAHQLDTVDRMDSGLARLANALSRGVHLLRRNTRRGSRRNVAEHYDLGNDFFSLFLDPTMMYSCALFPSSEASLEEASRHKLETICRKLELSSEDEVIEIGTGWGGFALHAARRYGCRVVTTTVSSAQHEYATEKIRAAGLGDRVEILLCDYRDLASTLGRRFDKLVSIEMIEAVGHSFLPRYFETCSELLRPDGIGLVQAITISDDRYESYRRSADFIQRYIFPGGLLPSIASMTAAIARASDLKLFHLEDITPHYARTLACWRDRFQRNIDQLRALDLPATFSRMWEFYFCYCEAAFLERVIGDVQLVLTKPQNRRAPIAASLCPAPIRHHEIAGASR